MNPTVVVNVAVTLCLTAVSAQYTLNRYGQQQQLAQQQNPYGNPSWMSSANRVGGWGPSASSLSSSSSSSSYGNNIMRHYPVSLNRYQTMAAGGGRQNALPDDYYDSDAYGGRPYDRMDYAVVRYPSYGSGGGGGSGYYGPSVPSDPSYDQQDDDLTYDGGASLYYNPAPAINLQYVPPSRYETAARYPNDKIHKFRKVFMSNLVSPSNAFKSPKEQQLYDFWESLVNGDLDGMRQSDDGSLQQQQRRRDRQQSLNFEADPATSSLYHHLPLIFQQLQQKQKLRQLQEQQRQQSVADGRVPVRESSSASSVSSLSSLSSSSASSNSIPRGNQYKQWANGSPLIKRSSLSASAKSLVTTKQPSSSDNGADDVQQLEGLKTGNAVVVNATTATVVTDGITDVTATVSVPMADGGQREYVLPRPAGEKSNFESLMEVIAEGGLRGDFDKNAAATYNTFHQEAKVNKKRSFVSDETSLAAQLGALRKN